MQIKNANDIDKLINDNQYKYVELINREQKKFGGYNATPKDLKNKITQIKKFLNNLPDDIYFLNFRISPRGDTFTYQYIKGTPNLSETPQQISTPVPITFNSSPIEKFQTIEEWKRQEKKIAELERELELLKLKSEIKETLSENKEPEKNVYLSFAENVLPSVLPIVDKFFQLKEREINLREQQQPAQPQQQKQPGTIKKIPAMGTPEYEQFCFDFEAMPDTMAENLLNRLQSTHPDIYKDLNTRFYESE